MGNVNIFETIRTVTSRTEPFHSQFLADVLSESQAENRALFDAFWRLAAPESWEVPARATITTEDKLPDNLGRIDVCIRSTNPDRVLGIEVKTTDSSATEGQLQRYLEGLKKQPGDRAVAIAYLTPFNRERAGDLADQLPTVREHDQFSSEFQMSRHVSWLDVAEITWDDRNQLWQQHRDFVVSEISSRDKLRTRSERDRAFNAFFGDDAADAFWESLSLLGISSSPDAGARVPLGEVDDLPAFVGALEKLIDDGEGISRHRVRRAPKFPRRDAFVNSRFGRVHKALFDLAEQFSFVWIQGKTNYGVRVAHENHPGGVSLVRSLDPEYLLIGQPR